jgi:Xaa-Pro aminopeptidase
MTDFARQMPPDRYVDRLTACRDAIAAQGFAALLIGVGPDLRYLTGFVGDPMERLTLLVIPRRGPVAFLVPRLEATKAGATPIATAGHVEIVAFEERDDVAGMVARLLAGAGAAAASGGRVGASGMGGASGTGGTIGLSERLWAMHVLQLQRALPGRHFEPAGAVMRDLRQIKDADETRLLRLAGQAADRTVEAIAAGTLVGRTEAEISREIRGRLVDEGHDLADFAIVGSGPNGASPHHDASDRAIRAGEPVVLDIGGTLAGYGSDTTRTIWVGGETGIEPDPEFRAVYAAVREAQARATAEVRPGIPAERIDAAARDVIVAAGYGEYFTHRVGHGIGLETHEDPYMVAGDATPLAPGMAFSVEPGIYLPGRWGVRLENIVMCTDGGSEVLNHSSLELRAVRG